MKSHTTEGCRTSARSNCRSFLEANDHTALGQLLGFSILDISFKNGIYVTVGHFLYCDGCCNAIQYGNQASITRLRWTLKHGSLLLQRTASDINSKMFAGFS
ncbi:hypothetical protein KP509_03G085500 [Ceratopteris richardii]|uniref:Uncharacterized protein n=1 Tax=Ceratopteris richardii TaxID=49495 RepID=A0A8T2V4N1_CERRI|nr:hypothetical protein KP509_03G085500 [Ceratopteris richardii]